MRFVPTPLIGAGPGNRSNAAAVLLRERMKPIAVRH